jgi:hypothetical protein
MGNLLSKPITRVFINNIAHFGCRLIAAVISSLCLSATIVAQDRQVDFGDDASDFRALFNSGSLRLINGANLIIGARIERGSLRSGDSTRSNDAYTDTYTLS